MAKLFWLWLELPDDEAERLIDALPEVEQDRFDAFLFMVRKTPQKALRELEAHIKNGNMDFVNAVIDKVAKNRVRKVGKGWTKAWKTNR